jgi:hypothetical protein
MTGSASAQQIAANGERHRARAVPVTTERRTMHARTTVLVAMPQPRLAASAVADVGASHAALNGPVLLIEGVRTHVFAISTGALAVFPATSTANPRRPGLLAALLANTRSRPFPCSRYLKPIYTEVFGTRGWLPAGACLNGLTRFSEIAGSRLGSHNSMKNLWPTLPKARNSYIVLFLPSQHSCIFYSSTS